MTISLLRLIAQDFFLKFHMDHTVIWDIPTKEDEAHGKLFDMHSRKEEELTDVKIQATKLNETIQTCS